MESFLPKTDEFKNNQIKECPYCNAIIPLSEYDDHMFCHQIDGQENGQQGFNINNYGIQTNNNNQNLNSINYNNNINSNNFNNNINLANNNNNNTENNFSLFQDNNISQPYINPDSQKINSINAINENINNNQINIINPYNQNNIQNFNNINDISNNNNNQNFNSNINNTNNNNNYNNIPYSSQESFIDKIKNYFVSQNNNNNNNNNNQNNQNNNERDIMNIPREQLSPEERAIRNRIEEQKAYEKKILGIVNSESQIQMQDNRSTGEKVTDFIQNNSNAILATIDIIGCLTLHTPSIARTITRVAGFVGEQYNNFMNSSSDKSGNINLENDDYNNIIRQHPELKKKDKDVDTIIKFLPVSEIKEIKLNPDNINNNTKCVICLSDFEIGDQVSALPCCHVFHTECIASWLKKHCQCPVCKFDITLKSLIGGF